MFEVKKKRRKRDDTSWRHSALNPTTNKTEIAALAFMSDESQDNCNFVLFKDLFKKDEIIFLVDKDSTNIDCIKKWFSKAIVLLCILHVLKFLRTLISTFSCGRGEKECNVRQIQAGTLFSYWRALQRKERRTNSRNCCEVLSNLLEIHLDASKNCFMYYPCREVCRQSFASKLFLQRIKNYEKF